MFCMVAIASTLCAQAPSTPAQELGDGFAYINKQVLEMAKDWPADKLRLQSSPGDAILWRSDRAHRIRQCLRS
jgi:hypothetical protein